MESKPKMGVIHADPTKDFFVDMITRDISVQDCIFDLIDNSIDGARRWKAEAAGGSFEEFHIKLTLGERGFSIEDNCGGISLGDAIDYAFHFGRRPGAPSDVKGGIGLYGIGMKRAIFKIGKSAKIVSHSERDSFEVSVDVEGWRRRSDWDFEYVGIERGAGRGTSIRIEPLNQGIGAILGDPSFANTLLKAISRDYSFLIDRGLSIEVASTVAPSNKYLLKDEAEVAPAVELYEDEGVGVKIFAGLIGSLPDDVPEELRPEAVERYGWFVVCNDRVVVAADKSDMTVWGNDGFRVWHPQYNGFAGFVFFQSDDQRALPWTTTKRDLDLSSPLYRRALVRMKDITDAFIAYTNQRKNDLTQARELEAARATADVFALVRDSTLSPRAIGLPRVAPVKKGPPLVTISYQRPKSEVDEIRSNEGDITMSNKEVGLRTFAYYRRAELGK